MKATRRPAEAPRRGREHEFEPQFGLPETLPADERLLWQGRPNAALVARRIFHLPVVSGYFALMLAWQLGTQWSAGATLAAALRSALVPALLAAFALAMLAMLARLTASTTAYTLTDRRVVMRIGIVLTVTYNLPLRQIDAANLLPLKAGQGELALTLRGDTRIAWLHLWPHARPWRLARPEPMLRCLDDAEAVSRLLSDAWSVANALPARPAMPAEAVPVSAPGGVALAHPGRAA